MKTETKQEDGNIHNGEDLGGESKANKQEISFCVHLFFQCGSCFGALEAIRAINSYVSVINDLKLCQYLTKD